MPASHRVEDQPLGPGRPEVVAAVAAATALRARLELDPAAPLDCIVELAEERLDIDIVIAPLSEHVSGFYLPVRPRPLVVSSCHHPVSRQRFTIAHELGHHVLGHGAAPRLQLAPPPAGPVASSLPAPPVHANAAFYTAQRSTDPNERAANTFAAELLTPAAGVIAAATASATEPPLDRVVRISAQFGMSAFAVSFRLRVLGLIDEGVQTSIGASLRAGEHLARYDALGLGTIDDELERHQKSGRLTRANPHARAVVRRLMAELSAA